MKRFDVPMRILLLCSLVFGNLLLLTGASPRAAQAQAIQQNLSPPDAVAEVTTAPPPVVPKPPDAAPVHSPSPQGREFTTVLYPSKDTYVYSGYPNINYGSAEYLHVMYYPALTARSLLQFSLSDLPPNAVVLTATLELNHWAEQGDALHIWANSVDSSWDEMTVTWNTRPTSTYRDDPPAPYIFDDWTRLNVTNIVNGWMTGAFANHGFLLHTLHQATATWYSRNHTSVVGWPRLTVTYITAGSPMMLSPTADTWVNEALPTTNYGTDPYLTTVHAPTGVPNRAYILLGFDISDLPQNMIITNATLEMWSMINRNADEDLSDSLINGNAPEDLFDSLIFPDTIRYPWQEMTVTWNSRPSAWGDDPPSTYLQMWLPLDVTDTVQQWYAGLIENFGIQVRIYNSEPASTMFSGRPSPYAPRLIIHYEPAPPPPCEPVTAISISGPTQGSTDTNYRFEAQASPLGATPPFTYTWTATDKTPVTRVSNSTKDAINFSWRSAGVKTVTVTVQNCGATVSTSHQVTITAPPPTCPIPLMDLSLTGPTQGTLNAGYSFQATASPREATIPITFTWQADGQSPSTVVGPALSSTKVYTWTAVGPKAIAVTAANCGGAFVRYHTINIVTPAELPDLVMSSIWYDTLQQRIYYSIQNQGGSTAPAGHRVTLDQGAGVPVENVTFPHALPPGAIHSAYFNTPRTCTAASAPLTVCADTTNMIVEGIETNNCIQQTLPCDMDPPVITSGPTVIAVAERSATIAWKTNEPCKSVVHYGKGSATYPLQSASTAYVTDHQVLLTGLDGANTYHFYVKVTDASNLSANSNEAFFLTQAPGTDPPVITYLGAAVYPDNYYELYRIQTVVERITGLDRIEFYYEGTLIKTEIINTGHALNATAIFSPYALGETRASFFGQPHQIRVKAINANGLFTIQEMAFTPENVPLPLQLEVLQPAIPHATLFVPGLPAPAGTRYDVSVKAREFEWKCTDTTYSEYLPPGVSGVGCHHVERQIERFTLQLNGVTVATYTPAAGEFAHVFDLDLSGKGAGPHTIKVIARASDGGEQSIQRTLTLILGASSLSLQRTVTRVNNTFEVHLTLTNAANATLSAQVNKLWDSNPSFQIIETTSQRGKLLVEAPGDYTIRQRLSSPQIEYPERVIEVTFQDGANPFITLAPGASFSMDYVLMPVLYETPHNYEIGGGGSLVFTDQGPLERYAVTGSLNAEVAAAFKQSDYLIVTSPGRLYSAWGGSVEIEALLSEMARLAQLKRGALGYLNPTNSNTAYVLDDLVEPDGHWSKAMYGDFKDALGGYMLIVGESGVVPAWDYDDLYLLWDDSEVDSAPYSDHRYADTKGDLAPDLIVGRVIGNNPTELRNVIRTSVNVAAGAWKFDRANALLASGTKSGASRFLSDAEYLEGKLEDKGWNVTRFNWNSDSYRFPISFSQAFEQYDGFAAGDVIAGAKSEIVIARRSGNTILVRDASGNTLSTFTHTFDSGDVLAVGDVSGDSAAEIIIGDAADGKIYIYNASGALLGSFYCGFGAYDGLTTGKVDPTLSKALIIHGSAAGDTIKSYTSSGVAHYSFSQPFSSHNMLATGIVTNTFGLKDYIIIGRNDEIMVKTGAGVAVSAFPLSHSFVEGDRLAAGKVHITSDHPYEKIVIGDRDDNIYIYTVSGKLLRTIALLDFEYYDGLAIADVTGDDKEEILMADRDDKINVVHDFWPDNATNEFKANTAGKSLILFRGHGNNNIWSPALRVGDFPLTLNNVKPFVFAPSCLTGNYKGNNNNSIAEAFLNSGALAYIGATQVSPGEKNSEASGWFIRHWESTESIGLAFTDLERHVWDWHDWSSDMWEFWVYEYNIYGDPKVGADGSVLPAARQTQVAEAPTPLATKTYNLPDYEVTVVDGYHYVDIPDGAVLLGYEQYRIPYWTASVTYRAGTVVRDVTLVGRTGLTVTTGLNLPLNLNEIDSANSGPRGSTPSVLEETVWEPNLDATHHWSVREGENGDVVLTIAMYPFFYDPLTTDARYYKRFTFDIQTLTTAASIRSLSTAKPVFAQGEPVTITLVADNTGPAENIVVDAVIKAHPNRIVAGLPLRTLRDLNGPSVSTITWNSGHSTPGEYYVEVKLRNMDGDVLALETQEFTLGITGGRVSALTAMPSTFTPGDAIAIGMRFINTGTVTLNGTAIVQIRPLDGITLTAEFTRTFTDLAPGATASLNATWDTTGVPAAAYRVVGYAEFHSMASPPATIIVEPKNNTLIYLPLLLKNR